MGEGGKAVGAEPPVMCGLGVGSEQRGELFVRVHD